MSLDVCRDIQDAINKGTSITKVNEVDKLLYDYGIKDISTLEYILDQYQGEEPKRITFRLNGCDIWFTASAPEDITLKQLLIQCDKIHPNYCACGICTTDEENVELEIDYNSIKKIADCSCEIEEDADDETD